MQGKRDGLPGRCLRSPKGLLQHQGPVRAAGTMARKKGEVGQRAALRDSVMRQ